jgi:heme/copper-type cytochrome/quinol oxidase subunit 4
MSEYQNSVFAEDFNSDEDPQNLFKLTDEKNNASDFGTSSNIGSSSSSGSSNEGNVPSESESEIAIDFGNSSDSGSFIDVDLTDNTNIVSGVQRFSTEYIFLASVMIVVFICFMISFIMNMIYFATVTNDDDPDKTTLKVMNTITILIIVLFILGICAYLLIKRNAGAITYVMVCCFLVFGLLMIAGPMVVFLDLGEQKNENKNHKKTVAIITGSISLVILFSLCGIVLYNPSSRISDFLHSKGHQDVM